MSEALPARQEQTPLAMRPELTPAQLVERMDLLQDAMKVAMKQNVDYGVIPGCQKPSLLQPGAEKLCNMFHLAPSYVFTKEWLPTLERPWEKATKYGKKSGICKGFIRYECECSLTHGPTGTPVSSGTGTANNFEPKFISRDPYEAEETVKQFARKRAMVNAARTATAASALFTQDIEDFVDTTPAPQNPKGAKTDSPKPQPSQSVTNTEKVVGAKVVSNTSGAPAPDWHNLPLGFGIHKDAHWSDVKADYLEWLASKPDDGKYKPSRPQMAKAELAYRNGQPIEPPPASDYTSDNELSDEDIQF